MSNFPVEMFTLLRGSWGPKEADALIAADGRWHKPVPGEAE